MSIIAHSFDIPRRGDRLNLLSTPSSATSFPSSHVDLHHYFHLIREAVGIRRHFDLLVWLQGSVQHYLPHEIMVAAWGDFHLGLVHYDVVSAMPGVRTEQSCTESLTPLLRSLFDRWITHDKKPYVLDAGESGFLMQNGGLQCALGGALKGMRSSLVHGISDERGRHDCLYILFSGTAAHGENSRSAIETLLPHLDTALRQVAHLPRQHVHRGNAKEQTPEPAAKDGEGHYLSPRECEIMDWVRKGKTNMEIGLILDISAFTVKNHLQRIFKKLSVYNRTQAVSRFEKLSANGR